MVLHPQAMVAFNALIALEFLFAAAGCLRYASRQNAETRALWILVASGFFLSIAGQIEDTYDVLRNIQPTTTATMADFFFLIYGIPVLLAISFTNEEANLRVLFWLDGAQAIVAAVLIYFQIFSILPCDGSLDRHLDDVADVCLQRGESDAGGSRYVAPVWKSGAGQAALLHRSVHLSLVLCPCGASPWLFGTGAEHGAGAAGCILGTALSAAAGCAVGSSRIDVSAGNEANKNSNGSIALLLDNLSPVLFTLVIVIMGARIAPVYAWIGFASITIAVALYGLRAALLQSKYLRSQQDLASSSRALVDAIDRLQDMSIRDGLTGIYNRTALR